MNFRLKSKIFTTVLSLLILGLFGFTYNDSSSINNQNIDLKLSPKEVFKKAFEVPINSFALKFNEAAENHEHLHEHDSNFSYRVNENEKWSDWKNISIDEDFENNESYSIYSKLHFVGSANAIEIRNDKDENSTLSLIVFNSETEKAFSFKTLLKQQVIAADSVNIISRADWGADENYRFYDENNPPNEPTKTVEVNSDWISEYAEEIKIVKLIDKDEATGKQLIWPLEYTEKVEKAIIHHSAGRTPTCSEETDFLKSIYKFHAIVRGWGDIGYNFIIGPCSGKIYEGRSGGFGVKGAHAGKFNSRTAGVMIMGNFQEDVPSEIAIESTIKLVKFLGEKYGFWPDGYSSMRGVDLPNVIGHRDVGNTSCPGENLEKKLPEIREIAAKNFVFPKNPFKIGEGSSDAKRKESFSAEPVFANASQIFIKPGEEEEIRFLFRNTGWRIWNRKTVINLKTSSTGITLNGLAEGNIANLKEATVAPGMIGTFIVKLKIAEDIEPKNYVLNFVPIINGVFEATEGTQKFIAIVLSTNKTNENSSEINKMEEIIQDFYKNGESKAIEDPNLTIKEPVIDKKEVKKNTSFFQDIDEKNIFYSFIKDLKEKEIINGQDGFYYPNRLITRGEFSKVLANASKLKLETNNKSFFDIAGTPFEKFIRILQSNNIVKGEKGMFYPDRSISRAEAVTMLVKAFNVEGKTSHSFKDIKGSVFEPYILKAAAVGIIGSGKVFDPSAPITRDQVAKIVSLAMKINKNEIALNGKKTEYTKVASNQSSEKSYGPKVRVDLGFSNQEFSLKSTTNYSIYNGDDLLISSLDKDTVTKVIFSNETMEVQIGDKSFKRSGIIRLVPESEDGVMEIIGEKRHEYYRSLPYNRYRGEIELRQDPDQKTNIFTINVLPLEKYLWGLGEEPNGQPIEKVKAIIVMARSYMENYRQAGGKFPNRFVDLKSDGTTSQVYLGYDFEINNSVAPDNAKATWGEVITYNGKVIRAPYFSKSGGHTITPGTEGNTWNPGPFPFALKVEDPWSCGKDLEYIEENGPVSCPEERRGHGVGVSAWGAGRMAEAGVGYKDILKYYLTGIEFTKLY